MRLQDKVIVVTGATSGIGKGIARVLAGEGACIVLAGRNSIAGLKVEEQTKQVNKKWEEWSKETN